MQKSNRPHSSFSGAVPCALWSLRRQKGKKKVFSPSAPIGHRKDWHLLLRDFTIDSG
jgi:hypothetical protein